MCFNIEYSCHTITNINMFLSINVDSNACLMARAVVQLMTNDH